MKRSILLYILPLLLAFGCKNTDLAVPAPPTSAVRPLGDYINNNYDLSMLAAALKKTNLLDSLNGAGPYTMWAPNNAAFALLGITTAAKFDSVNVDSLRYALKGMILPSRTYISDLPTQLDTKYQTLNADQSVEFVSVAVIGTNADAFNVTMNGCAVNGDPQRNIALQNGVLHILSNVPKYYRGTVQDYLAADTTFSLFQLFLKKANMWDSLKLTGPYTVWAPVNSVFRRYGLDADSIGRLDVSRYDRLVFSAYLMNLQPHHVFSSDFNMLSYGQSISLGEGYSAFINYGGAGISRTAASGNVQNYNSPNPIALADGGYGADNLTDNGVVFHLANVMFYPDSLLIK